MGWAFRRPFFLGHDTFSRVAGQERDEESLANMDAFFSTILTSPSMWPRSARSHKPFCSEWLRSALDKTFWLS